MQVSSSDFVFKDLQLVPRGNYLTEPNVDYFVKVKKQKFKWIILIEGTRSSRQMSAAFYFSAKSQHLGVFSEAAGRFTYGFLCQILY